MSPINVNENMQGYSSTVKDSIADDGIRLPFPVVVCRWMNGDVHQKKANDATYFGGWAASADSMEDIMGQLGIGAHPSFTKNALINNENKEYQAYISRSVLVAVCAKRKQWTDKGSHVQLVALLAEITAEKSYKLWGTAMLTSKGYSARFIENALAQWDSTTAQARREFASGLPSQFFWAAIGTFGTEPIIESVGKKEKSPVTPAKCWLPKEFNDPTITRHFVGEENMARMAEIAKQSEEWRKAWAGRDAREKEAGPDAPENFTQPGADDVEIPF